MAINRAYRPRPVGASRVPLVAAGVEVLVGQDAPPSGDALVVVLVVMSVAAAAIVLLTLAALLFVVTSPGRTRRTVMIIRAFGWSRGRGP